MLFARNGRLDDLTIRGARVVDPGEGIDETLDVTVEKGVVTRLEPAGSRDKRNGHHVVAGERLLLAPAFVDPHAHLRTPGREDEEDIVSGTRAAAAGGYCAVLAMPNTDPVVDCATAVRALADRARREADVPVGFFAALSKGQEGSELTEMVELAEAGAVGFSDDGKPVASPALLRRALQYNALVDRPVALHCEEPALSRAGQMHEGATSAELGFGATRPSPRA